MRAHWESGPASLVLVRHAESMGNLADTRAHESEAELLELDQRDADVPLSPTGQQQADALGRWLSEQRDRRPSRVLSSPYRRAADTAAPLAEVSGVEIELDERLRERDLGVLDGLTGRGIRSRYPEEAERRKKLGKFYYQPPSGESWCDVVLRVRSLLSDLRWGYEGEHLCLVTHQAVIMAFRFALERLSEEELLDIDREVQIPNVSRTTYGREGSVFELVDFADASALESMDVQVTDEAEPTTEDQSVAGA